MLLAVAGLAGCGQESEPPGEMAPGQEPFLRYCASCHGNAGEGRPPAFPPLAGSEWLEMPPEAVAAIVLSGLRGEIEVAGESYRGYMPPMRHIDDDEIAAIIGYMKSSWSEGDGGIDAGRVAGIRQALSGRGPLEGREGLDEAMESLP
ncbi:MAG: c-type cytochrome [Wenzhouxiangella sp.]